MDARPSNAVVDLSFDELTSGPFKPIAEVLELVQEPEARFSLDHLLMKCLLWMPSSLWMPDLL